MRSATDNHSLRSMNCWLAVTLAGFGGTLLATIILGAYMGHSDVLRHTIWQISDSPGGWFSPRGITPAPILGQHHFGDFQTPVLFSRVENPYSDPLPYEHFPFNIVLGGVFDRLGNAFGLLSFLTLLVVGFFLAPQLALAKSSAAVRLTMGVGIGLLSLPFLFAFDRGNFGGLLTLCLVGAAYGEVRGSRLLTILTLAFAANIKLYMLIFLLPLLFSRRFSCVVYTLALTIWIHLCSTFILFGLTKSSFSISFNLLQQYLIQAFGLSDRWGGSPPLIKNSSFFSFRTTVHHLIAGRSNPPESTMFEIFSLIFIGAFLMLWVYSLWSYRTNIGVGIFLTAIALLLVPNNMAAYNWGIIIPAWALVLRDELPSGWPRNRDAVVSCLVGLSLVSYPVPFSLLMPSLGSYALQPDFNSLITPAFLLVAFLLVVSPLFSGGIRGLNSRSALA